MRKLKLIVWVFLFSIPLFTQGQNPTQPVINSIVTGKITDGKTKIPLEGAVIQIKGTTNIATSDSKGNFTLRTAQKLPFSVVVSHTGYKSEEVLFNTDKADVKLEPNIGVLEEVTVIGYGTQRKKDNTGSVASLAKDKFNQVTPSVDNLLKGSIAGVVVTQSSGAPGASSTVRIRGGNSITGGSEPLYVVDGVLIYNDNNNGSAGISLAGASLNVLASINPADIESIDVLKDASATAIYGSRGANGVIIINTKKGSKGQNNINYQAYVGTQQAIKKLNLLNARQWAEQRNDIIKSLPTAPNPGAYTNAQLDSIEATGGYDWQSAALREAIVQSHQLSLSGGDEKSRYALSGNYFAQDGVVIGSDLKRFSGRVNYERNISSALKFGVNLTGSNATLNGTGVGAFSSPNNFVAVLQQSPVVPIYNSDGSFNITRNPFVAGSNGLVPNPIYDLVNTKNETKINRVLGSFFAEYKITKDLVAKVSASADLINTKQNYYAPSTNTNGIAEKGRALIGNKAVHSILNENTLTYNKYFGNNNLLTALVGYTTQTTDGEIFSADASNFISDINTFNAIQDGTPGRPFSDAFRSVLNSWLARVNYSLNGRYNFTLSARADGSSRFGNNSRWGYFPSAGFSWNLSEERFLSSLKKIGDVKLRLSAGNTGNQEIPDYLSLAAVRSVNYSFGGVVQTGFAPTRLPNPDLRWERTSQYDAGIDLSFFKKRLVLTVDAYYKKTTDLLVNVPVPLTTGFTSVLTNIGAVENKGIELAINTQNIITKDFSWTTNFVYSLNRNKVLEIGNGVPQFFPTIPGGVLTVQQPVIVKVGLPLGSFWGYQTNGLFQTGDDIATLPVLGAAATTKAGDRRYADISGSDGKPDGKITAAHDKVYLGSAQPKFVAGLTNSFSYKGFDLQIFFQGVFGNKIFNALRQNLEIPTLGSNGLATLANRWTPDNPTNDIARATSSPAAVPSDRFIEDGSFIRLRTLTLGYTLPSEIASKIKAKNIKFFVSGQNILTFTKYTGYDPEVSTFEQSNLIPGIDYGTYPGSKTYTVGLDVTF
ncbi:MAG: TonB-dependent receptor [Bacteroidetes bacterium]|nr:TonB-dependent receptor [Bacteroidota bacterium]